jgi:hypothetical protein
MRRRQTPGQHLTWGLPKGPPPKHPYRDSALVYGFFAVMVVLIAWATGGPVVKATELAGAFFVATVSWSWFRWYQHAARQAAAAARDEELGL